MNSLVSTVVQMQSASVTQQIGVAVTRQQIKAQRAMADLVAGTAAAASPPAPPGQGQLVDRQV
jgi:hypothetical protein